MFNMSTNSSEISSEWQLWEVFVQSEFGAAHEHFGSVRAPDRELALQNARDLYARRGTVLSMWVVPSHAITASTPSENGIFFDPSNDKPYRSTQFYTIPRGVKGL